MISDRCRCIYRRQREQWPRMMVAFGCSGGPIGSNGLCVVIKIRRGVKNGDYFGVPVDPGKFVIRQAKTKIELNLN